MSNDQRIKDILSHAAALHWTFHELEERIERYEAALKVAQRHLNDQCDPFMTARNTIKAALPGEDDKV